MKSGGEILWQRLWIANIAPSNHRRAPECPDRQIVRNGFRISFIECKCVGAVFQLRQDFLPPGFQLGDFIFLIGRIFQ